MIEKLSLNILIPSIGVEHNFLVPITMSVENAISLIVETLVEEYPAVQNSMFKRYGLIQKSSGKILNPSCSFKQLGIIQGDNLLLM